MSGAPSGAPQPGAFGESCARFFDRLQKADARLIAELESSWRDILGILERQQEQLDEASRLLPGGHLLKEYRERREQASRLILQEAAAQWKRKRPYQRALTATVDYERSLEDLSRELPQFTLVDGPQALKALQPLLPAGWMRRLVRLRRKPRPLPLRAIIGQRILAGSTHRSSIQSSALLILALGTRNLRRAWEPVRFKIDAAVLSGPSSEQSAGLALAEVQADLGTLDAQWNSLLSEWEQWRKSSSVKIASGLLSAIAWHRKGRVAAPDPRRALLLSHWIGQGRALEAGIRLETDLGACEDKILSLGGEVLNSLDLELSALNAEVADLLAWLEHRIGLGTDGNPPRRSAEIVPASSRLAELEFSIKSVLQGLPVTSEVLKAYSAYPRRRSRPRDLHPRQAMQQVLLHAAKGEIGGLFQEVEAAHRKILLEIERAREVVAFGLESELEDPRIPAEALQNALSLLQFTQSEKPAWRGAVEIELLKTLVGGFVETRLMLTRHRLGNLTYLARQGLRRALSVVARATVDRLRSGTLMLWRNLEQGVITFLVFIGWMAKPSKGRTEVITRPFLPAEYTVDLNAKDLPALYRRLFRFEPVEDPRFLVGREDEMAAIGQARALWAENRPVALILIGQRGSGKTSLLNCAVKKILEDLEVIRGSFSRRLTSESELRGFLAGILEVPNPGKLEDFLAGRRRVVIMEELERAYLRTIGGYEAVRGLQRLIAATSSSTLWILAVNQIAFRFLDAAVGLGRTFSHQIDAGTATRDDLRKAVLLRHHLSGLRIQYAPAQPQPGLIAVLKRTFGGGVTPQEAFFETLDRESVGVYRTAFEIWLGHIEAFQGGLLQMKALQPPDLSPITAGLKLPDLFTLMAILQHGSLVPEEQARIFHLGLADSRSQIDELVMREIVEPDPVHPGFRVRPEALRVVREVLYRNNLL